MSQQSIEPPGQSSPDKVHSARNRRWVAGMVAAAGVAALVAIWLWWSGHALSPEEQLLVGTWAVPLPPNPPPHAIQQIYELRPDGCLALIGRPVDSTAGSFQEIWIGTWRVVDGQLLLEAFGPDPRPLVERILDSRSVGATRMRDRFHILGQTNGTLQLEGTSGYVLRLERLLE
jgi:hypothetical protein